MLSIVTWNVNSLKSRLPQVLGALSRYRPDIVLLQELKCTEEQLPRLEIEDQGYNIAAVGQKTYNGVAILSKYPLEETSRILPGEEDSQARYIEALVTVSGIVYRLASVYVPNGQSPDSDKFAYKLRFLDRLYTHAAELIKRDERVIIGGDYNIAPESSDVFDPQKMLGQICFHPEEHKRYRSLMHLGYIDAFRAMYPQASEFSWWDYRGRGWELNHGMRIDHLLLSPSAADQLKNVEILKEIRGQEKASDHAPVMAYL